jgi:hypothetical protein
VSLDGEAVDVALVLQDLGDRDLQLRRRHRDDRLLDLCALRMRVSMSAMGSLMLMGNLLIVTCRLPAGLDHAGNVALEGELADLVAAQAEHAERAARRDRSARSGCADGSGWRCAAASAAPGAPRSALRRTSWRRWHGLQLGVLLGVLGNQLFALFFALLEGQFGHGGALSS